MVREFKLRALHASARLGITGYVGRSRWRSARLLILGYHGISEGDEHQWDPLLYIQASKLRRRFELLRDGGFVVLALDEALCRLHDRTLPRRSVVITFDDGTLDFATLAVPLLREFRFPATLYLTTYYCDFQRPVFDTMFRYLLWRGTGRKLRREDFNVGTGEVSGDRVARTKFFLDVRARARHLGLDAVAKDEILSCLADRLGQDYAHLCRQRKLHLLSPQEVTALPAEWVSVQLHTHRHRVPVDARLFAKELLDNRERIQQLRPGTIPKHFCYPSGVTDERFLPWLREFGSVSATTCELGLAKRSTEVLMLPRLLDTSAVSSLEFLSWTEGISGLMPHRRLPHAIVD